MSMCATHPKPLQIFMLMVCTFTPAKHIHGNIQNVVLPENCFISESFNSNILFSNHSLVSVQIFHSLSLTSRTLIGPFISDSQSIKLLLASVFSLISLYALKTKVMCSSITKQGIGSLWYTFLHQ